MKKISILSAIVLVAAACGKAPVDYEAANVSLSSGTQKDFLINDTSVSVMSRDVLSGEEVQDLENDLLVGLLDSDFGKPVNFGGAVVAVVAGPESGLEMLKLSAIPNQRIGIVPNGSQLDLVGPSSNKKIETLLSLPVVQRKNGVSLVDLEPVAENLEVVSMMLSGKEVYKVVSNKTFQVNYTYPTLVFDVESVLENQEDKKQKATVYTRWYLEILDSKSNFRSRPMTEGVGYFGSSSFSAGLIRKFDLFAGSEKEKIAVVIKNFPNAMKPAAAKALEEWNDVFERNMSIRPIEYSFMDVGNPLSNIVMAGDPRFNVIEWDLFNDAPYEGYGPCLYEPQTGKNIACAALIQGNNITMRVAGMYNDKNLIKDVFGEMIEMNTSAKLVKKVKPKSLDLNVGKLKFEVNSLKPEYLDEHHEHADANLHALESQMLKLPKDKFNAMEYLQSYIQGVVAHEFGHNLGLRHNFKGSLFQEGEMVTASIMDYLFGFKDYAVKVGPYDDMAIAYGYAGKKPSRTDMYCSDEHVYSKENPQNSIECMRYDYSNDPYSFYRNLMIEVLTNSLSKEKAERYKLAIWASMVDSSLEGMVGYIVNAAIGIPTKSLGGQSKDQIIQGVATQIHGIYCSYVDASAQLELGAENVSVLTTVLDGNIKSLFGEDFFKQLTTCEKQVAAK